MSAHRGPHAPDSCSALSARLDEPLDGTAPYAVGWLAIEQPGPWGRKALTESQLDRDLGARIDTACAAVDVRAALIRRPGRDPIPPRPGRALLAAHSVPGRSWLLAAEVEEPAGIDWEALASAVASGDAGSAADVLPGAARSGPHLLVCSNGRRDVCCAVQGRPIALAVAGKAPDQVWESTHLGGHRFAPTAAVLPSGTVHGRLDTGSAVAALQAEERGEVVLETVRGRTCWTGAGQAAELAVRRLTDERALDALLVTGGDEVWTVRHTDGRAWEVTVSEQVGRTSRPESCGKDAVPVCSWVAGDPRPL